MNVKKPRLSSTSLSTRGSVLTGWSEVFWKLVLKSMVLLFHWERRLGAGRAVGGADGRMSAAHLVGVGLLQSGHAASQKSG